MVEIAENSIYVTTKAAKGLTPIYVNRMNFSDYVLFVAKNASNDRISRGIIRGFVRAKRNDIEESISAIEAEIINRSDFKKIILLMSPGSEAVKKAVVIRDSEGKETGESVSPEDFLQKMLNPGMIDKIESYLSGYLM